MATEKIAAVELVIEALASGGQQLLSPEALIANLKGLDMKRVVATEKDAIERDMKRVVEKRKELKDLEESIQSLGQALAHTLKEREVADAKCGKLEKYFLERCREDDRQLADKLAKEMEVMKRKIVEMDILEAENNANVSKISALNEKCGFLEENRGQLEKKMAELKKESRRNANKKKKHMGELDF